MVTNTAELIDSGEKRDRLGRKRTPKARRVELLEEYRGSGLTQAAFAKKAGLNYTTFCSWVQADGREQVGPVKFAQVQLPPASVLAEPTQLEVRLPDGTSVRGNKPKELAVLVRALRS